VGRTGGVSGRWGAEGGGWRVVEGGGVCVVEGGDVHDKEARWQDEARQAMRW